MCTANITFSLSDAHVFETQRLRAGSVGQIHPTAYSYMAHTLLMVFTSLNGWAGGNKDDYFVTRKPHASRFTTGEVLPEHSRAHWSARWPGRFCTTAEVSIGAGTVQLTESKICARGP